MLRQIYGKDRREGNQAVYNGTIKPLSSLIKKRAHDTLKMASQSANPLISNIGQYRSLDYAYRRPGDVSSQSSTEIESDDE